jgi:hypothetical protein
MRARAILAFLAISWVGCSTSNETAPSTTAAPDGGAMVVDGGDPTTDAGVLAKRLVIQGEQLLDNNAKPIRLRGGNLEGIDEAGATELADTLHFNFVRLRLSFEGTNRDDADPTALSAAFRTQIDGWVKTLASHRIWILIEMRTDDPTANTADLYTTSSKTFDAYRRAWVYLASRYHAQDYVAGYGLLAEPSSDKTKIKDYVGALLDFQKTLMTSITMTGGDTVTPFFVGAASNYDALELWNDRYYDGLAPFAGRLVYEANFLTPKPWIDTGKSIDGSSIGYPTAPVANYDALLTIKAGEDFKLPDDGPDVFKARTADAASWSMLLSPGFPAWYFKTALAFRAKHHVPLLADQFGATNGAAGSLAYEKNLIDFFEANDVHWSRWGYNAGSKERRIAGNADVTQFYATLGNGFPSP